MTPVLCESSQQREIVEIALVAGSAHGRSTRFTPFVSRKHKIRGREKHCCRVASGDRGMRNNGAKKTRVALHIDKVLFADRVRSLRVPVESDVLCTGLGYNSSCAEHLEPLK